MCRVLLCGALFAAVSISASAEDPWADAFLQVDATDPNPGFNTPEKTIGAPVGAGTSIQGLSSLHSIGTAGSSIVFRFDTPVTDDPANPFGLDCVVFGNGHW